MVSLALAQFLVGQYRVERTPTRLAVHKYGWFKTVMSTITVGMGLAFVAAALSGAFTSEQAPDNDTVGFGLGAFFVALGALLHLLFQRASVDIERGELTLERGAWIRLAHATHPLRNMTAVMLETKTNGFASAYFVMLVDANAQKHEIHSAFSLVEMENLAREVSALTRLPVTYATEDLCNLQRVA